MYMLCIIERVYKKSYPLLFSPALDGYGRHTERYRPLASKRTLNALQ